MSIKQAIEHLRLLDPVAAELAEKEVQKLKEDSFYEYMKRADYQKQEVQLAKAKLDANKDWWLNANPPMGVTGSSKCYP